MPGSSLVSLPAAGPGLCGTVTPQPQLSDLLIMRSEDPRLVTKLGFLCRQVVASAPGRHAHRRLKP